MAVGAFLIGSVDVDENLVLVFANPGTGWVPVSGGYPRDPTFVEDADKRPVVVIGGTSVTCGAILRCYFGTHGENYSLYVLTSIPHRVWTGVVVTVSTTEAWLTDAASNVTGATAGAAARNNSAVSKPVKVHHAVPHGPRPGIW